MTNLPRKLLPFLILLALSCSLGAAQEVPARKRRRDSFFGLHFDLHPDVTDKDLGRDVTDAMVEDLINSVHPDYVQHDCKGHPGYLGYPSHVGTSAPGIVNDSLAIWRRVTARHGVSLFIHFSGDWDSLAVKQHPQWAAVGPDGKPSSRVASTFGPYVDQLMIPELKEAIQKYDLDGAWVDGECWAVVPDWLDVGSAVREILRNRLAQGGKVLVVGSENAALFAEFLGVQSRGRKEKQTFVTGSEVFGNASGLWQEAQPTTARVLEMRFPT